MRFDPEEKEILESFERGEWRSVLDEESLERYRQYARYTLRKTKRINLRISERDLVAIKRIAQEEGIPYQTLIASLIHKYVESRLRRIPNEITRKAIRDVIEGRDIEETSVGELLEESKESIE